MSTSNVTERPFSTVLLTRPTASSQNVGNEDEHQLFNLLQRQYAKKVRVVSALSGGAHMVIPGKAFTNENTGILSVPSVAVRIYYSSELVDLEAELCQSQEETCQKSLQTMKHFIRSYKFPILFFVIPQPSKQLEQLKRPSSAFMKVQQLLLTSTEEKAGACLDSANSRIFLVSDIMAVLQNLATIIEALSPEKRQLKDKYYRQEASRLGYSDECNNPSFRTNTRNSFMLYCCRIMKIPEGDMNVLLSFSESLQSIISSTNISDGILNDIPITDYSKRALIEFFTENGNGNPKSGFNENSSSFDSYSMTQMGKVENSSFLNGSLDLTSQKFLPPAEYVDASTHSVKRIAPGSFLSGAARSTPSSGLLSAMGSKRIRSNKELPALANQFHSNSNFSNIESTQCATSMVYPSDSISAIMKHHTYSLGNPFQGQDGIRSIGDKKYRFYPPSRPNHKFY